MVTLILFGLMEGPVHIKGVAGAQGTQTQNGLGSVQTPAGAAHCHAVFDQVAAGLLDDSCSDGHCLEEVAITADLGRMVEQVADGNICGLAFL